MKLKKTKIFSAISIVLLLPITFISCQMEEKSRLTDQQSQLVQELNQRLIPLVGSPLLLTDGELDFLDSLESAKIVALGEATHGTGEFFRMKHRVFRYLVENRQHRAFGFEADFAESLYFDNYVCHDEGNLTRLMRTKMIFWTWKTEEVKDLLEWMRMYNRGRSEEDKIHYLGFDCQFTIHHVAFIQAYLLGANPDFWQTAAPLLEQVEGLSSNDYQNMPPETFDNLKTQLETLGFLFEAQKDTLVDHSSLREYRLNRQLLRTFRQAFIVTYFFYNESYNTTNWRDLFMAENARWIADFMGQDSKITLWAHNGHVANDSHYSASGSMGYHLRKELGDLYRVVGFGFSKGRFTAVGTSIYGFRLGLSEYEITREPREDSINFIFHHASLPGFVLHSEATPTGFALHLDAIPTGSAWDSWLDAAPRPFLWIGSGFDGIADHYYHSLDLREQYNWILYFDHTTASHLLPR
jgi:erythromycin esterase